MKNFFSLIKLFTVFVFAFILTGCVHDDKYDNLDVSTECVDLTKTISLSQALSLPLNTTIETDDVIEGYVSSTDITGNIYKTIFIQDSPTDPTQGFVVSLDMVSTYAKYPQGAKIYIKLKGLAIGTYGGLKQLGAMVNGTYDRIPENMVSAHLFKSCSPKVTIVPKVLTLAEMSDNDKYLGCYIQVNNAEFDEKALCNTFAPDGISIDRQINDTNTSLTTRVVRNSGYASFANQILPAGKGTLKGILSKFNSTYQIYLNTIEDVSDMYNDGEGHYPRKDGIAKNPCEFNPSETTKKTVAELKQLYTSGNWNQISGDYYVKAQVTANDKTKNLFKYIYIQDETGGIRVNINKTNLFQDLRFKVGRDLIIKLKDLYVSNVNGEIQLGTPYNNNAAFGGVEEVDIYKRFFDSNEPIRSVVATERSITQLTAADVGRWIKLKDLQFIDSDLGKPYAGSGTTNRTLEDCSGNNIILRTSNFADFGTEDAPLKSTKVEVEPGKGDVYAILSVFNGTYQLWIPYLSNIDLDNPRCDGSVYTPLATIFSEEFASTLPASFTTQNVTGAQVWLTSNQGTAPNYYAVMNGFSGGNIANEDWLISKPINLTGKTEAHFSFDSDVRYNGNAIQVLATDNFTGDATTTNWTVLPATLDTNSGGFGFVSSGSINLSAFLNKNVTIAFKYTSTTSAAATWEIDNILIKGK